MKKSPPSPTFEPILCATDEIARLPDRWEVVDHEATLHSQWRDYLERGRLRAELAQPTWVKGFRRGGPISVGTAERLVSAAVDAFKGALPAERWIAAAESARVRRQAIEEGASTSSDPGSREVFRWCSALGCVSAASLEAACDASLGPASRALALAAWLGTALISAQEHWALRETIKGLSLGGASKAWGLSQLVRAITSMPATEELAEGVIEVSAAITLDAAVPALLSNRSDLEILVPPLPPACRKKLEQLAVEARRRHGKRRKVTATAAEWSALRSALGTDLASRIIKKEVEGRKDERGRVASGGRYRLRLAVPAERLSFSKPS